MEDLFVQEAHRKKGIARSLMQFLAQTAIEEDCGRIDWSVLKWNQLAIDFYRGIGASEMSEWVGYRLEDKKLCLFSITQKSDNIQIEPYSRDTFLYYFM